MLPPGQLLFGVLEHVCPEEPVHSVFGVERPLHLPERPLHLPVSPRPPWNQDFPASAGVFLPRSKNKRALAPPLLKPLMYARAATEQV